MTGCKGWNDFVHNLLSIGVFDNPFSGTAIQFQEATMKGTTNQMGQRLLASVMALVYLFSYLGTFVHMLEEEHVVCVEHGHMVHADDVHETDIESELTSVKSIPSHDDHHHCAEAFVFNSQRILGDRVEIAPAEYTELATLEILHVLTPGARGPTMAVLAYAPKTSPPTT